MNAIQRIHLAAAALDGAYQALYSEEIHRDADLTEVALRQLKDIRQDVAVLERVMLRLDPQTQPKLEPTDQPT